MNNPIHIKNNGKQTLVIAFILPGSVHNPWREKALYIHIGTCTTASVHIFARGFAVSHWQIENSCKSREIMDAVVYRSWSEAGQN